MVDRPGRVIPAAVAGVTVVLSAAAVAVALVNPQGAAGFLADNEANSWVAGLAFGVVGALLLRDAPSKRP